MLAILRFTLACSLFCSLCAAPLLGIAEEKKAQPAPVEPVKIGEIYNVHRCGPLLMAGQPTPQDLLLLSKLGVKCLVTFRMEEEVDWDEKAAAESAGMEFKAIRYGTIDSLTPDVFAATRKILRENQAQPLMLHCGSATRVAAVWLAYRVLDEKVDLEQAVKEAEKIGLRSKGLRAQALKYIEAESK